MASPFCCHLVFHFFDCWSLLHALFSFPIRFHKIYEIQEKISMTEFDTMLHKRSYGQTIGGVIFAGSIAILAFVLMNGAPWSGSRKGKSEADDARAFLKEKQVVPLSGGLQSLLTDPSKGRVPSEPHALLGQPAPAFSLEDVDGIPVSLESLLMNGPVVVVFYYGYSCNHCVAQLFGLNDDLKYFRELGATVVAIGPDTSELTRTKYAKYGAFGFPVLSDEKRVVASRFGVYRPKAESKPSWEAHGTFVVDRKGTIQSVNTGDEPFTQNVTLLAELAKLEGRTPAPNPEKP
ncbi:MAG: peroxiredoxin family protein [Gemmataceae bacterium]